MAVTHKKMHAWNTALSELLAVIVVVVIAVIITSAIVVFLPGSPATFHSNSQSKQSVFSSSVSATGSENSPSPGQNAITTTYSTSCMSILWAYPADAFNQTITLENSTIISPANSSNTIHLAPHQALYFGFRISNVSEIFGEVNSSYPFNAEILVNAPGEAVFPISSSDTIVSSKTNITSFRVAVATLAFSGRGPGNYAILFSNTSGTPINLSVVQPIEVKYPFC